MKADITSRGFNMGNIKNLKNIKNDLPESPTINNFSGSRASSPNRADGKKLANSLNTRRNRKAPTDEMKMFNQFILGKTDLTDEERDEITRQ